MVEADARFDALIIGAGFSGLYTLHRLRQLGVRTRVLEMAENVGGTWLYNRYPGARCDIESIEYSYSFSDEIQQEWVWTESMPAQPEIEAYLNFVADRLDLRRDIQFHTKVIAMAFDEETATWVVRTEAGESFTAPFLIAASGILSVPLEPDIRGMGAFAGTSLFTSRWPKEGFDLTGKRVGVIGTGSTGVQLIPVVAREAMQLSVFQRSPTYTLPWRVHRFQPGELDEMKARYGEIRAAQREHPIGAARLSAFSVLLEMLGSPPLKLASREEQLRAIEENGVLGALSRIDVRGRNAMSLGEFWAGEGPLSYLGLAVAGFPNLFTVQGPGGPSPASNFVAALEQHVEWISDCIEYMRANGIRSIEALATAQQEWIDHATSLVAATVLVHPSCNSWYNGGNVPGKKRMYMGYTGGIPEYRRRCDEIAAAGYTGFKLA
jgi:cation diffusion facilitator CzcD-associated flavoprotein CzcO